jgi:hypothetical protein
MTIDLLLSIVWRCNLTVPDVAAFAGVSPSTVERAISRHAPPQRVGARRRLEQFVQLNVAAERRGDLRVVPDDPNDLSCTRHSLTSSSSTTLLGSSSTAFAGTTAPHAATARKSSRSVMAGSSAHTAARL